MGVTQNVAVTFDNIAINDCYELVNGKIELVVDPNKQLLDVDALVDAVKELLPNVKLFAQNYKGTAEDIESAKYLKQQLEAAKAALLTNDSYDTADKNLIQQGYDQQLAGLTYLIENGGSCSAPIDSTTNLAGGRLAAFDATYADVCTARNATIQGAKKAEEGIFSAIWKVLQRCQSTNFAPHNGGLVPKCLWDNNLGTAYLSDPAFIAGFIDGAYLTVSDLFQTAVSASECAICFNPTGPGFYSAKCQDVRSKTIEFFEFFRTLATDGQLRDKVWGDLKQQAAEYLDQTICVQEPICRYNQGKLMFDIASMFVGIGEVSGVVKTGLKAQGLIKVVQAIEKVESKLKTIHRTINGIKWKIVKLSTNTKVYKIASATGIEIGEFSQGLLRNLRWKTGSGWIQSKVLYGVDYINSTGYKVKNGVLKLYKRTNCRLSADAADDACDWAVEGVVAGIKEFFEKGATKKGRSNRNIKIDKPRSATDLLETNAKYNVDGYLFETDADGRVKKVSGDLQLNSDRERELSYQDQIQFQDKQGGDDGGHLIGNQFYGPNEAVNIVPMRYDLNQRRKTDGAWYNMEAQWAKALKGEAPYTTPQKVNVEITIKYGVDRRPVGFVVKYKINNSEFTQNFIN
ncbi:DNA/RNA non-specific endonuclease [Runella limosa]|uniref:DNA/RNA non-specific endonuclease n=1 Tax=Runella limosa TaxID=370978 RepID=UPI0003FA6688|nr:DNA/RNA non-specific endonuclease [Runella limosa]